MSRRHGCETARELLRQECPASRDHRVEAKLVENATRGAYRVEVTGILKAA